MKQLPFETCWWIWVGITFWVVFYQAKRKTLGAGLVLAYLVQLWANYGIGGWIYQHDWYVGESYYNDAGLEISTYGIIAFGIGTTLLGPFLLRLLPLNPIKTPDNSEIHQLPRFYVLIGLLSYFVLLPLSSLIPSSGAILSAMWRLIVAGLALYIWKSYREKNFLGFILYAIVSLAGIPALTIISQGFLSFGATISLAIFSFIASFFRPRWKLIIPCILLSYLGMSFYVTYMRDRDFIRESVWSGESLENRSQEASSIFKDFEWFDSSRYEHLNRLDERMNQNLLLGAAIDYMGFGLQPFAHGETLWMAVLSLIPRALWPEKTIMSGGSEMVSRYTGIEFEGATTVGIGQVLDFYINFGAWGVFCGMLLLSTLVSIVDIRAGTCLEKNDWGGFAYWYLPGLSLIDVISSLFEISSSAVAGLVAIYFVNRWVLNRQRRIHELGRM